jgi:predicted nucleic acid-binding protein
MKALLDTNIIIHRETDRIMNQDIGILFRWIDKGKYTKCIHPITIEEIKRYKNKATVQTFQVKLDSYEILKTVAPLSPEVEKISLKIDKNVNDRNDTLLINELFNYRVDLLITEDKKIHFKASLLGLSELVFTIDSFLEKVVSENPELVNYKVLSVTKKYFGEINLKDPFFDSFREDYRGFDIWFQKKSQEIAYVTHNKGNILSFLYLKAETSDENYHDIKPNFIPKKRLKIGTFKVVSNGVRLGERFLKIIFDNALQFKVDEIYVNIFDKRDEQKRLIALLEDWGFVSFGVKSTLNGDELVYVRNFSPRFSFENPRLTYPFITLNSNIFIIPIYPQYHTELLPDSMLTTESPYNFIENEPHRNAISKVYISRSIKRDIKKGDIIIFYRTADRGSAYYTSLITTIGIVENKIENIIDEKDFILKCRKRSVFPDIELEKYWNYNPKYRPFIINFLYSYSFEKGNRINRERLLALGILSGEEKELRGLKQISLEKFLIILKEAKVNESIIVDKT